MIIAIDGGVNNIGICILFENRTILYTIDNKKCPDFESKLLKTYNELSELLSSISNSDTNILHYVYEDVNITNRARSCRDHLKIIGVIELLCKTLGIKKLKPIVAKHWKKVLLGNGNATKEEVLNYVNIGKTQHEADAYCIAKCALLENDIL